MKCLSVRQPWAWLIVHGYKDVENRSWKTDYRGIILIHAGKTFDIEGWRYVRLTYPEIPLPSRGSFSMGAIIGTAVIADIVRGHSSPWAEGGHQWGWVLEEPWAATLPLLHKGQLGLFNVVGGSIA